MRASFTFGKIIGIPIGIHASWFIACVLITWSLAGGYFPTEYPGWATTTYWLVAVLTALLFFASVVVHELGHAIVARREGVPVLGITLFIFGGIAQIGKEPPTAGAEFRIAIAGPITSALLGGAFGLAAIATAALTPVSAPAVYLARINLLLALFNLAPGFPLDGGRVLRAILWGAERDFRRATKQATTVGHVVATLLIVLGVVQMFQGNFLNGLWIAFIGWFLNNAADATYQQVVLRDALSAVTVRELMTSDCPMIEEDLPLDRLVHDQVLGTGRRCFFVARDGHLQGMVTLHTIKDVPRDRWDHVTARDVMIPVGDLRVARPEESAMSLLERMDAANVNQMPVMDGARLQGVVAREHLLRYIRNRGELGI